MFHFITVGGITSLMLWLIFHGFFFQSSAAMSGL